MEKQEVSFAVLIKDGVVTQVGKSVVLQPCIHFGGGSTKWYDGKMEGGDKDGQACTGIPVTVSRKCIAPGLWGRLCNMKSTIQMALSYRGKASVLEVLGKKGGAK